MANRHELTIRERLDLIHAQFDTMDDVEATHFLGHLMLELGYSRLKPEFQPEDNIDPTRMLQTVLAYEKRFGADLASAMVRQGIHLMVWVDQYINE